MKIWFVLACSIQIGCWWSSYSRSWSRVWRFDLYLLVQYILDTWWSSYSRSWSRVWRFDLYLLVQYKLDTWWSSYSRSLSRVWRFDLYLLVQYKLDVDDLHTLDPDRPTHQDGLRGEGEAVRQDLHHHGSKRGHLHRFLKKYYLITYKPVQFLK
jgi:hypothetical protein